MGRDPLKVAIVAGLNLADELVRERAASPQAPSDSADREGGVAPAAPGTASTTDGDRIAARLIQEIDRALEPEP